MEHLDFILWMILWPVSLTVCDYIDAKRRKFTGEIKIYSKETNFYFGLFVVVVWLVVGAKLF